MNNEYGALFTNTNYFRIELKSCEIHLFSRTFWLFLSLSTFWETFLFFFYIILFYCMSYYCTYYYQCKLLFVLFLLDPRTIDIDDTTGVLLPRPLTYGEVGGG